MPNDRRQADESSQRRASTQKSTTARRLNGAIAAVILLVFVIHSLFANSPFSLPHIVVWTGCALIGAHVITCIVTSVAMLTDRERPASPKKKKHLVLKWVSGIALGAVACAHAMGFLPLGKPILSAIALLIAWHAWICARSFLKDLGFDTRHKPLFRTIICAAAFATIALLWL